MKKPEITVLHITAHLGGGVGKALSGLVSNTLRGSRIKHTIACLEPPEKQQFLDKITGCGCEVCISPGHDELCALMEESDVVQLEWWNHPATISALCRGPLPPMRLLLWCHISGLHNPIIPRALIQFANKCLFTSPCSYGAAEVSSLVEEHGEKLDVVHSSGGFEGLKPPKRRASDPLSVGYLGSLNFAKLHPRYVEFLKAVKVPGFTVRMIGDTTNKEILERQCEEISRKELIQFRGYSTDISSELSSINIMAYLLNPEHYGTTENALLETMAMEIVPIVLNNPAESYIVENGVTGLVVQSPNEFASAMEWLFSNPSERIRLGKNAAYSVKNKFSVDKMVSNINKHYRSLLNQPKQLINFKSIFGSTPSEWFLSCQKNPVFFRDSTIELYENSYSIYSLLERTKGTVFHFHNYFPSDPLLSKWVNHVSSLSY